MFGTVPNKIGPISYEEFQRKDYHEVLTMGTIDTYDGKIRNLNLFLLNRRSTTHVVIDPTQFRNPVDIQQEVVVGNGEKVIAKQKGWVVVQLSSTKKMILKDVLLLPSFLTNIISVLCQHARKVCWKGDEVVLESPDGGIPQVKRCKNGMCYLSGLPQQCQAVMLTTKQSGQSVATRSQRAIMDISLAHQLFGHASEKITHQTLAHFGIMATGSFEACRRCTEEKGRRKNVAKISDSKSLIPCEQLLLDTTGQTFAPLLWGSIYDVYVEDQYRKRTSAIYENP